MPSMFCRRPRHGASKSPLALRRPWRSRRHRSRPVLSVSHGTRSQPGGDRRRFFMANTARKDPKRLATTDERERTKESAPEPGAKRKSTSAFAEAPPSTPRQADPPEAPKAAPPKRRRTPALKAMAADPERAAVAAPALKIASPP